jgi:hypothetical protein
MRADHVIVSREAIAPITEMLSDEKRSRVAAST